MAYLDNFDAECECGNGISFRDLGEDAECCEWCAPEMRFDGIMWRKAVGAGYLEQMETHGLDAYYSVETILNGEKVTVGVFANSEEIANYIVEQYLEREAVA